jgi:methionyl-tRNA formyltransferase
VTIWRSALPADGPHQEGQPGEVVEIDGASLTVATGDGLLRLEEWEGPEGYRPVKHAVLGN